LGCLQVRFAKPVNLNAKLAALAKTFVGKYRYVMGARNPKVGFDCSGLTQYLYSRLGKKIADTADPQRHQFRAITQPQARPGDLIFFHQGRGGYVWHVGVYEGGNGMVAAANEEQGIRSQRWNWWPNVSFGTVLH
jgi:cell wall-associated NlpC family hydrolase